MTLKLLAIGLGGFAGAVLRFLADKAVTAQLPETKFPTGIFLVNIVGCLAAGFLAERFKGLIIDEHVRLSIFAGLLGAFTTFSTFSLQTAELILSDEVGIALLYVGLSIGVGLACIFAGRYAAGLF